MDDEIKKRTALDILKKKFFLHHADKKSALLPVYKADFPNELEMNFTDIGSLLMSLEKIMPEEIKVETVANLETDPEYFLQNDLLVREQIVKKGSCYKVRYTPKEKRPDIIIGVEYLEEKNSAYLIFSKGRKINLGKKNTRTAKLAHAFLDIDTNRLTVTKRRDAIFSEILIGRDKNKMFNEAEKEQILINTMKEINRKIHTKNIPIRLLINGKEICDLEVIED